MYEISPFPAMKMAIELIMVAPMIQKSRCAQLESLSQVFQKDNLQ